MPEIPEKIVVTTAKATSLHFENCDFGKTWRDCPQCVQVVESTQRTLKAAAPLLAGHIARQISVQQPHGSSRLTFESGIRRAARIARETFPKGKARA